MNTRLKYLITASTLAAGLAVPQVASAGGFYLQEQSVRGAGRAFSGETADTGAASLWWNPAAIGGIDQIEGHFAVSVILPSADIENNNTLIVRPQQQPAPVGGDQLSSDPIETGVLPAGAVAMPINDRLSVGLAVSSPYSFTTDYDATSWVRYTALKSHLRTYDIQPSVAYMVTPELSVGAALNIEYSDAKLTNALPNLSAALPDGEQELKGDGWDLGWSAGVQYRSGPLMLGAAYKSSVKHKLSGTLTQSGLLGPLEASNGVIDTDATFRTPWQASVGARYAVSDQLTLNAQVVRIGWGEFDAIRLGEPVNAAIPEDYRNTWSFAGGVDYAVSPAWTVRAGVQHDQTPTQSGDRDARVPDGNRWNFAVGTSYDVTPGFTVDAAFNYLAIDDATIDRTTAAYAGTPVQTPIIVDGTASNANALIFSLGGRFAF